MASIQLSQLQIDWTETDETWLDTGILFPFFNKQLKTDAHSWGQYLLGIARKKKLCTTQLVVCETQAVWKRWSPRQRTPIAGLYKKLFKEMTIVSGVAANLGNLSPADVSLKNRRSGKLITSDKLLFQEDNGPTLLVVLKEEAGRHFLATRRKWSI